MVRIHYTQRFPNGTRVSKYFNGYAEPFEGTVDQHSDVTDFYHISYDDGDSEEMTEVDVENHLLCMPKPQKPPKAPKQLKTLKLNKTSKPPKASKPSTPPAMKRANSDSSISLSSPVAGVPSPTSSRGKSRPKVLSLNANAPGLMRSNSFTGPSNLHDETKESLSVSIPDNIIEEDEDEGEEEEEEGEEEEEEEEEEVEEEIANDEEEEEEASSEGTAENINQLIGKPVEKVVMKEGCGIPCTVQGAVASYFPATKMFRVMYFDGECCDLTYQQVFNSIPADLRIVESGGKRKRKADEVSRNEENDSGSSAPPASPKRPNTLDLNAPSSTSAKGRTKRSPTASSPSSGALSPVSSVVRETDMLAIDNVEFNIVRKVLFIIVSTVNNKVMETQLEVLSSAELKDKEALEMFVRKDGLTSLAELLSKWEDQEETEQGVLLVLKALAVLPGVTKDVIIDSNIGKKVRGIEKHGSFRDPTISGLASWVIQKMKADVGAQKKPQVPSKSVNGKSEEGKDTRSRASSSPRGSTPSPRVDSKRDDLPAAVKSANSPRPSKGKKTSISNGNDSGVKRSNSASHLLNLMNSRNGRDTSSARRDRDIFGNITSQNKRRLGTANNWRARRSTVVLDQVTKRVTENAHEVETLKTRQVEEDDWQPSKISFADKESVCPFDKEVEVSKLLVFRPLGSMKAPERPPVKSHSGPLRSILRVRLPPRPTQEAAPQSSDSSLTPPTVHSTARPTIDPIVVPSERPSLSSEAPEDGTVESPMFDTSKLSKVVSPTEKRKQGFSPPPCIPMSEQPPLDFTEEGEEGEVSAVGGGDEIPDAPVEALKEPKPAEADKMPVVAVSPIVSEDSSEDGEVSSSEPGDKVSKPDAAAPPTCSTGPKDGGAAGIESPVQQATTMSA